ncbi:alpha-L-fucosidase [Arthrospiribacter ruber]|uniref:Alpha-L-fucosidase n=1 Tax=Arthrospiribacter ruber TaxID=2487934 RepID=A0A951IXU9_9BACT|nr:alpha-L-fucosidase [Arthrospiribacter ruber]MBW3467463.1 alpha-L-fucosidase [Arthrospiribacter ruber]
MKKYLLPIFLLLACQAKESSAPEPVLPIPSERQLAWHELEYYGFVHFNMNTFSDMEWGMGDEKPSQFDPSELDTRQWARIVKDAGMKGIIITAKHHDGFCLWPSAYTEHSVKNSPWRDGKGDLIQELKEACDEYGLKMGIYYSPWDRNHADYGKPEYITYMRNQLTELLSNYGDIFEVWFDGANGGDGYYGGANETRRVDKKTYYDWENTFALVRELQPNAVIFGDAGPDVRWVGNENGYAYETTWSNLLRDSVYAGMPEYADVYASGQENGTHWVPAEADVSIRPGWYYHEYEDHKVKTLAQLLDIYYKSIGRNASLLINFPVDRRGLIHEKDEQQILKLAEKIKEDFRDDLAKGTKVKANKERGGQYAAKNVLDKNPETYWAAGEGVIQGHLTFEFDQPTWINRFMVREYFPLGQRVRKFSLEGDSGNGWNLIAEGTTIGAKRILRFEDIEVKKLRLNILDAKSEPLIMEVGIFDAPKLVTEPVLKRKKSGEITLEVPEDGVDIFYTIDDTTPDGTSLRYEEALVLDAPLTLQVLAIDQSSGRKSEVLRFQIERPKAEWLVLHENQDAEKAIDENPDTFWQSDNDELIVDLGEELTLEGFTYLPPQNRYMKGIISRYGFAVSSDGKKWREVALGEFSNIKNNPVEQRVSFSTTKAKYIRLRAMQTVDGGPAAFAELGVITGEGDKD